MGSVGTHGVDRSPLSIVRRAKRAPRSARAFYRSVFSSPSTTSRAAAATSFLRRWLR